MSRVIAGIDESGGAPVGAVRRGVGSEWNVFAALGAAFTMTSLADVGLAFYPLGFGSAEWEFATVTTVMNNVPLAVVGIGLMAVAGIGRRSSLLTGLASVVAGGLTLVILLLGVLFVKNLGEAMASVTEPVIRQGLTESIGRTSIQLVAYLVALVWLAIRSRTE
jgi:hypothetical protein